MQNLDSLINGKVDILSIAETKLDDSFPDGQFILHGYKKPYRLDVNGRSGGLLVYVNSDIPSRLLTSYSFPNDLQIIPIEINLRKEKWIIFSIYKPPKQNSVYFLNNLSISIDYYSKSYSNLLVMGDFNLEPLSSDMKSFLDRQGLHNHMKDKTCWKSPNGTCIDLILSNKKYSLQNTRVVETGLSDHHSLIYSMLKCNYTKLPARKYCYRDYKKLDNLKFLTDLQVRLKQNILSYGDFEKVFSSLLDEHVPLKTKFFRANNSLHMSKPLRKAIMKRSKLKNIANKTKLLEDMTNYRKQRNLVVSLNRKEKKKLFDSVNVNSGNSNNFWKICKPLFTNKVDAIKEKILLVEGNNIISNDNDIATVFNEFFNTITDNLNIPMWNINFPIVSADPVECAIAKFRDHPSIITIKRNNQAANPFEIREISSKEVFDEILLLKNSKKTSGNIPVKMLKLAAVETAPVLVDCFNNAIQNDVFPDELKWADIIPIHKKNSTTDKANYRPISLLPTASKVFERLIFKQISNFC